MKAREVAQAPFKNILMMGFMMWMAGNTVHLFSIGITFSALWQPISALQGVGKGYLSDHGSPSRNCKVDMSTFRESVKDYLLDGPSTTQVATKLKSSKRSNNIEVEKFSGLRIRDLLLSSADLCNRFSDIRFIQLQAIGNMLTGDTISGCWATVGVLTEKGNPKMSSTEKNFGVWKMGCLNESTVSVFLFNDAYGRNLEEPVGSVFALFNSNIRKDGQGKGFTVSVYSAGQIVKLGAYVDYGVCKGKRMGWLAP